MNSNCLETLKGALLHVEKIQDERDPSGVWSVELSRFAQMLTKCITEEQKRMNDTTPAPQAWIDIKERKPEDGKICFVHFEDGGYGFQIPGKYYAILSKITHWMPVPPLPKQDPFEEWWKNETCENRAQHNARYMAEAAWNAGVQWARKSQCSATEQAA